MTFKEEIKKLKEEQKDVFAFLEEVSETESVLFQTRYLFQHSYPIAIRLPGEQGQLVWCDKDDIIYYGDNDAEFDFSNNNNNEGDWDPLSDRVDLASIAKKDDWLGLVVAELRRVINKLKKNAA